MPRSGWRTAALGVLAVLTLVGSGRGAAGGRRVAHAQGGGPAATPSPFPYRTMRLPIAAAAPLMPINLMPDPAPKPLFDGDLAFNRPTYASTHWDFYYPSRATDGTCRRYRTASSSGSWMYVDLGAPTAVHWLIHDVYVDERSTAAPRTDFIASNDLVTWQILVSTVDHDNVAKRQHPRLLALPQDVTARYVGAYAVDWDGGWGSIGEFAVLPPDAPTPDPSYKPCVAVPTTPAPTAVPTPPPPPPPSASCVCRNVQRRVPPVVIADALANPDHYLGWMALLDPGKPPSPANPRRTCLTLHHMGLDYNPLWNKPEWRVGCP